MTVKRTTHTALARISSHKSGGRAEIIVGHSAVAEGWTDGAIRSSYFLRHPVGTSVVIKIKLSGRRRLIQYVKFDEEACTRMDFRAVYKDVLEQEADDYLKIHGGEKPFYAEAEVAEAVLEPKAPEPIIEDVSDWTDKIYVDPKDEKLLSTINKLSNKKHVSVMMIGPSGYGKTSIPQQKAHDWNMNFLRWDCATVRDPEEFFGFRGAVDGSTMSEDGETYFAESEFTKAVEEGNAVIVLDELNRIDPYISNILFPLLDHAGRTSVAGHEVTVGPNVIFFATVNLGFQFTGTFTLDTALTNRFAAKILVNSLPSKIEENILMARGDVDRYTATKIVKLMRGLRGLNNKDQLSIDASTRVSIQIAELVGCGLDLKSALVYVVINGISDEEAKLVIDQLGFVS